MLGVAAVSDVLQLIDLFIIWARRLNLILFGYGCCCLGWSAHTDQRSRCTSLGHRQSVTFWTPLKQKIAQMLLLDQRYGAYAYRSPALPY